MLSEFYSYSRVLVLTSERNVLEKWLAVRLLQELPKVQVIWMHEAQSNTLNFKHRLITNVIEDLEKIYRQHAILKKGPLKHCPENQLVITVNAGRNWEKQFPDSAHLNLHVPRNIWRRLKDYSCELWLRPRNAKEASKVHRSHPLLLPHETEVVALDRALMAGIEATVDMLSENTQLSPAAEPTPRYPFDSSWKAIINAFSKSWLREAIFREKSY